MFRRAPSSLGGSGGSRRGADLMDLVPFMQGSDRSFRKLRAKVEKDDDVFRADQLTRVRKLGEGGFGIVYQCKLEPRGRVLEDYVVQAGNQVAVKQLKSRAQIMQEHFDRGARALRRARRRRAPRRASRPPFGASSGRHRADACACGRGCASALGPPGPRAAPLPARA